MDSVTNLPEVVITANRINEEASYISTPDEYSLDDITILSPLGNLNIKAMMNELSYFEDIFRGAITGHVLITDSTSLIDKIGMTGNEFLKLKFRKSKHSKDSSGIEKIFRIMRVGERERLNHDTEMYSIHFCSEELFLSEQTKISKSYKGKKISEMVEDVLINELKIKPERVLVYPTIGVYDFIIPYKKPLETVNWLSNYALSPENNGADFIFFESKAGFVFTSLQALYAIEPYRTYTYRPRGVESTTNVEEMSSLLTNIKSYKFIDTFDTLYGVSSGIFANRVLTVDPLTRSYRDTIYSYQGTNQESPDKMNRGSLINNYKNRLGLYTNECFDSVYKVMFSNADQKKALGISDKNYAVAEDIRAEKYVPHRTSQLAASNYSRIQFSISGDPSLTVGRMIKINLPSNNNEKGTTEKDGHKDKMHSGNYLITAIRHIIDINMKYDTIVEVAKDTFGISPANYDAVSLSRIKEKL